MVRISCWKRRCRTCDGLVEPIHGREGGEAREEVLAAPRLALGVARVRGAAHFSAELPSRHRRIGKCRQHLHCLARRLLYGGRPACPCRRPHPSRRGRKHVGKLEKKIKRKERLWDIPQRHAQDKPAGARGGQGQAQRRGRRLARDKEHPNPHRTSPLAQSEWTGSTDSARLRPWCTRKWKHRHR